MADLAEPDAPPTEFDDDFAIVSEADALLDELVGLREERAAETGEEFALPGYRDVLWASYRLLGPKRVVAMMMALNDKTLKDSKLVHLAATFLDDATTGVYMKRDGERVDFEGFSEDEPAGWLDLPARLVPPRPGGKPHTPQTALRVVHARDNVLVGHALDVAGWMQSADAKVGEDFVGESEGGTT